MDKVVIDTNVFVSAYLKPTGVSARLIDLSIAGVYQLVVSPEILDEYLDILFRKGISRGSLGELNKEIWHRAIKIKPTMRIDLVKEDPDDNNECASEGKANVIVSGNPHLLRISSFRGIKIISPGEYLKRIGVDRR